MFFYSSAVRWFHCVVAGAFSMTLCSDFNEVHRFIEYVNSYHFISIITIATRFPGWESSSLVDHHIWTNNITMYKSGIVFRDFTACLPTFLYHAQKNLIILKPKFIFIIILRLFLTILVSHCNPLTGLPSNHLILIPISNFLLRNLIKYSIANYSL